MIGGNLEMFFDQNTLPANSKWGPSNMMLGILYIVIIYIYFSFFSRLWYNAFLEGALEYSSLSFFFVWGGSYQHSYKIFQGAACLYHEKSTNSLEVISPRGFGCRTSLGFCSWEMKMPSWTSADLSFSKFGALY